MRKQKHLISAVIDENAHILLINFDGKMTWDVNLSAYYNENTGSVANDIYKISPHEYSTLVHAGGLHQLNINISEKSHQRISTSREAVPIISSTSLTPGRWTTVKIG